MPFLCNLSPKGLHRVVCWVAASVRTIYISIIHLCRDMATVMGSLTAIECVASQSTADVRVSARNDLPYMRCQLAQSSPQPAQSLVKSELTSSPDSRLLSLPPALSVGTDPSIASSTEVVIQPSHKPNIYTSSDQNVPISVNGSTAFLTSSTTRTNAFTHFLGPLVQGCTSPSSNHVLTHRRQRRRTSNLIVAPNGTVTTCDIPKHLPPAPSTAPRRSRPIEPELDPFSDFLSLKANYLDMLKDARDGQTATDTFCGVVPVSPADLHTPSMEEYYQDLAQFSQRMQQQQPPPTPELYSSPDFNDLGDEFLTTSPETDILNTPVIAEDDMLTGMFEGDDTTLLFPAIDSNPTFFSQIPQKLPVLPPPPSLTADFQNLYTLTPESPILHEFTPSVDPSVIFASPPTIQSSSLPSTAGDDQHSSVASSVSRGVRRTSATGTRKGVTPEALVSVDAPTQPRKYITPSATSRKELPSIFARKRSRSAAFGEDEDEVHDDVPPLGPKPTERELIEHKRRQNTVAARRSRKRKLEYQQHLEERVKTLEGECERLKERVAIYQEMLRGQGLVPPMLPEE